VVSATGVPFGLEKTTQYRPAETGQQGQSPYSVRWHAGEGVGGRAGRWRRRVVRGGGWEESNKGHVIYQVFASAVNIPGSCT
jgi:hypothetical protein